MKEHYNKVLRDSDARVARFMEIQILDRNDPFFGGFPSADSIDSLLYTSSAAEEPHHDVL